MNGLRRVNTPSWVRKDDEREKYLYLELPDRMSEKEKKELIKYYREKGLKAYRALIRSSYPISRVSAGHVGNIEMNVPEVMI